MATTHKIKVGKPNTGLGVRLRYANEVIKVLSSYIQQKGELDQGSLVFAERVIKLYGKSQVAPITVQPLQGQLLDLSWSLVTRVWSDSSDEHHALREMLAKERCHPTLHDGTDGELLYFALRYVHLAKKARQISIVGDNWPDDVDETAKYLLSALRKRAPELNPTLLAQDVFRVLSEGAPGIGAPIEELSNVGVFWLK